MACTLLLLLFVAPSVLADWSNLVQSPAGRMWLAKQHAMAHAQGMPSSGTSSLAILHNVFHSKDQGQNEASPAISGLNKPWHHHDDLIYHHDLDFHHDLGHHSLDLHHDLGHDLDLHHDPYFHHAVHDRIAENKAIEDHENYHKFLWAKEQKEREAVQEWLQEKEEQKRKFEQFQKLMDFHKEQHKRVADMMKWNALMKIRAEKVKDYQFGLLMKHFEDKKMKYIFETIFGLVKFCKSKDTINSMHKYLAPKGTKPANGTDSLFDFSADLAADWPNPWSGVLPKPKSTEEAKKMFFKGLVNTLCASAKTYIKHVKAMAAQINGLGGILGQGGMDGNGSGMDGSGGILGGNGNDNTNDGNGGSLSDRGFNGGSGGDGKNSQTMNV